MDRRAREARQANSIHTIPNCKLDSGYNRNASPSGRQIGAFEDAQCISAIELSNNLGVHSRWLGSFSQNLDTVSRSLEACVRRGLQPSRIVEFLSRNVDALVNEARRGSKSASRFSQRAMPGPLQSMEERESIEEQESIGEQGSIEEHGSKEEHESIEEHKNKEGSERDASTEGIAESIGKILHENLSREMLWQERASILAEKSDVLSEYLEQSDADMICPIETASRMAATAEIICRLDNQLGGLRGSNDDYFNMSGME